MDQHNEGVTPTNNSVTPAAATDSTSAAKESSTTDASSQILSGTDNVKLFAILGYVVPFLFFLPLINEVTKQNAFARFHANQQLVLLLCWVALQIVATSFIYPIMGYGIFPLIGLVHIGFFVLAVLGILNVINNMQKELPLIGQFKIIK